MHYDVGGAVAARLSDQYSFVGVDFRTKLWSTLEPATIGALIFYEFGTELWASELIHAHRNKVG